MGKIKITQTKSSIKSNQRQKNTLAALGLKRIGHTVEHENNGQINGMAKKVSHLVNIENVE